MEKGEIVRKKFRETSKSTYYVGITIFLGRVVSWYGVKMTFYTHTAGENYIGAPKKRNILDALSNCYFFQYYDIRIRLIILLPI